jgi:hypothetical protein
MISAIGQIAGAVAVVASVVYLAVQIRNQNKESGRNVANLLVAQYNDMLKSLSDTAECADVFLRAVHSFDELDGVSKLRFGSLIGRDFKNFEGLYIYRLDGTLDPRIWRGIERCIADLAAYPGVQSWWATRRHWHTDEFCELVDKYIAKSASPTLYAQYPIARTGPESCQTRQVN